MFTGIIEAFGQVKRVTRGAASAKIVVEVGALADDIKVGDSVAVDGACLTVAQIAGQVVTFDVMTETLDRTTLGDLKPSDKVNLERSLKLSDRLGGHLVSGHVDGVGILQRKTQMPGQCLVEVEATPEVTDMMIQKGSVAI
ncbi:MAG: riboflavin synthase, partial [Planctomycetes bacterium]|nr:riboflavin synthase [Planctomycetota bacterium]